MGTVSDNKLISSLIIGRIAALVATFAMPVVLTRFLCKSDYGIYSQFYTVLGFITGIFGFGLSSNLFYFYPSGSSEVKKKIVFQTFLLLLFAAALSIGVLNFPFIDEWIMGHELISYRSFIIVAAVISIPVGIMDSLYVVKSDKLASTIFPPLNVIIKVVLIISLILITNTIITVLNAVVISQVFIFAIAIFYVGKEIFGRTTRLPKIDFSLLKQQLMYSIPFGIAVIVNTLLTRFDKIVCISFLTASEYATYSVAFFGIPAINQLYESFSSVYIINMTKAWQDSDRELVLKTYNDLVIKNYSYTIPMICGFFLFAPELIELIFTSNYLDSVPLFRLYILSFIFVLLGSGLILRAIGKTKQTLYSYLISSLFSLPLTYFLIKNYGIYGAMFGALFGIISPKIIMIFYEIKALKCSFFQYLPFKKLLYIFFISLLSIVPFAILKFYGNLSIAICIVLGALYIIFVAIIEVRFDLFVISRKRVLEFIKAKVGY